MSVRETAKFRPTGSARRRERRRSQQLQLSLVGRGQMLRETAISDTHRPAVHISNVPRWGSSSEIAWRRHNPGQHVRSLSNLPRPQTASALRPWLGTGASAKSPDITHHRYNGARCPRPASAPTYISTHDKESDSDRASPMVRDRLSVTAMQASVERREQRLKAPAKDAIKFDSNADPFSRLSKGGKYRLSAQERQQRTNEKILAAVRRAVSSSQLLYGSSISSVHEAFKTMDSDGSGTLDRFEFRRAVRRLGLGLSAQQIEDLLEAVDKDCSGDISLSEFEAALLPSPTEVNELQDAEPDEAMKMLQTIESKDVPWGHERPWRERLQPRPDAPIDRVRLVAPDGSIVQDAMASKLQQSELSRAEKHYNQAIKDRFAAIPSPLLTMHVWAHDGRNGQGVNSVAEGRCYFPDGCWRICLKGVATPGVSTRRSDGSRPPREVVREWLKASGWCFNKLARSWYKDLKSTTAHCNTTLAVPPFVRVAIDQLLEVIDRVGLQTGQVQYCAGSAAEQGRGYER